MWYTVYYYTINVNNNTLIFTSRSYANTQDKEKDNMKYNISKVFPDPIIDSYTASSKNIMNGVSDSIVEEINPNSKPKNMLLKNTNETVSPYSSKIKGRHGSFNTLLDVRSNNFSPRRNLVSKPIENILAHNYIPSSPRTELPSIARLSGIYTINKSSPARKIPKTRTKFNEEHRDISRILRVRTETSKIHRNNYSGVLGTIKDLRQLLEDNKEDIGIDYHHRSALSERS